MPFKIQNVRHRKYRATHTQYAHVVASIATRKCSTENEGFENHSTLIGLHILKKYIRNATKHQ